MLLLLTDHRTEPAVELDGAVQHSQAAQLQRRLVGAESSVKGGRCGDVLRVFYSLALSCHACTHYETAVCVAVVSKCLTSLGTDARLHTKTWHTHMPAAQINTPSLAHASATEIITTISINTGGLPHMNATACTTPRLKILVPIFVVLFVVHANFVLFIAASRNCAGSIH